ncbi:GroES-like protein [Stipitochalara longipes BDJ]|nr:GroES-like protein [Stipitochalara longipes BDJ]
MSKTSVQYQVLEKGGPLTKVIVPYPTPGPSEICIRPKAVALNPLDWKSLLYGVMVESWPAVLGIDAAGIVDSVGESVKDFKAGDEVFSLCGLDNRKGAFQEVITVPSHFVAKKPASFTFEEAASLPICYLTAASAINDGLHIPLPHLDPAGSSSLTSILVLGGSSGVGAAAIQLLRLALPSATILTTSSAQHHDHLISLGADKCFERAAQDDTFAIKAATHGEVGVDAILDTVQASASQPSIFTAFNPTGPKVYSQVMTRQTVMVPDGVKSTIVFGRQIFDAKGGMNALPGLASLIERGKFKLPNKVEIVGKGAEGIELGLKKIIKGVSGAKYVVSM